MDEVKKDDIFTEKVKIKEPKTEKKSEDKIETIKKMDESILKSNVTMSDPSPTKIMPKSSIIVKSQGNFYLKAVNLRID